MLPEKLVKENYARFCRLEGSKYIASGFALLQIIKIIKFFNVKSVLEIGLGIGSISDTVLKMAKNDEIVLYYSGTEANEFCNNELKNNVEDYAKIEKYKDLTEISPLVRFDLVIIDGQDNSLQEIVNRCKSRAIIFIEGDRKPQTKLIMSVFPKARHVQVICLKKNEIYSPGDSTYFVGGGQLIFTNPNIEMKIYWVKEKMTTYIKRHLRKLL